MNWQRWPNDLLKMIKGITWLFDWIIMWPLCCLYLSRSLLKFCFTVLVIEWRTKKDIANQSPYLEAVFVEPILEVCNAQANFREIVYILRSILLPSLSDYSLKKYLFYLIDHDLIIYHGKEQIFVLTEGGVNLLYMIKREKKIWKSSIDN